MIYAITLLFVKIETSRRHMTEMKCIPQIRYMAIDKRLELPNCTWSVSMWFQYGVNPLCAASRVSMRRGMESKRPWISSWGMSLHAVYASPQSVKCRCWRTLTNKSPTNHIPDMFWMGDMSDERAGQGNSDTRRLWKKACTILAIWGWGLSCWNMACRVAWSRGSTSGCKTYLM